MDSNSTLGVFNVNNDSNFKVHNTDNILLQSKHHNILVSLCFFTNIPYLFPFYN